MLSFFRNRTPSLQLQLLERPTMPDGEIEAVLAADRPLDDEKILTRSRVVSSTMSRMPYVGLEGKYNKRWYVDAIALPHNSVRNLLSHLFSVVTAVQRLALDLTPRDVKKVRAFVAHVARYVRVLLEAEEKVLYPTVERRLRRHNSFDDGHPLHPVLRTRTKRRIVRCLDQLTTILVPSDGDGDGGAKDGVAMGAAIRSRVDEFAGELLEYYTHKETILPRLVITSVRGARERTRLEGQLIAFFASLGDEFFLAAVLASPLRTQAVRDEFFRRHWRGSPWQRRRWAEAQKEVEHELLGVAREFERACSKYESRFSMDEFLSMYANADAESSGEDDGIEGDFEMALGGELVQVSVAHVED